MRWITYFEAKSVGWTRLRFGFVRTWTEGRTNLALNVGLCALPLAEEFAKDFAH